ncbi:hypothetical protein [Amycolatopsis magusensis]|uniref:hypothetical protein n=1 Tax=Amycolatopsis magusensis TaxID=882444 RepID=UPI0024A99C3C|nr:hypothetical protein [Amycolatopsis magusensis]MDI5976481.1 hypothetical protein [Amycolatopsis magusensis]
MVEDGGKSRFGVTGPMFPVKPLTSPVPTLYRCGGAAGHAERLGLNISGTQGVLEGGQAIKIIGTPRPWRGLLALSLEVFAPEKG